MQPCVRSNDCRGAGHEECHSGNSAVEKQYTLHNWLSPSHFGTCIRKQERVLGTSNSSFCKVTQQRKPKAYSTFWKNKNGRPRAILLTENERQHKKTMLLLQMNKMKKHNHNSPLRMYFLHIPPLNTTYQAALKQSATGVWMKNVKVKLHGWQTGRWLYQCPAQTAYLLHKMW